MSQEISRRSVARGAAWSIPAITVASAAPAMAASPCSQVQAGTALPADAFTGYFAVSLQSNGGLVNKIISFIAGVSLDTSKFYASCPALKDKNGKYPAISSFAFAANNSDGTMTLTNNNTYTVTGGAGIPGTGTAGSPQSGCSGPGGNADACNSYVGVALQDSSGTSSANPKSAVLHFTVTVAGFGTTPLTYTIPSFVHNGNWNGTGLVIT